MGMVQCIGVVSGCCCKEVYTVDILTIIIHFPYSLCISSFFGSSIPTSLFIFKMFFYNTNSKTKRQLLVSNIVLIQRQEMQLSNIVLI